MRFDVDYETSETRYCKSKKLVSIKNYKKGVYYGEWSKTTQKPDGRGIFTACDGAIHIQTFKNGYWGLGSFLKLDPHTGLFYVGELYEKEGKVHKRGKTYSSNGF